MGQGPEYLLHVTTEEDQTPPLTLTRETLPARLRWALANETLQARVSCTTPQALAMGSPLAQVRCAPPMA